MRACSRAGLQFALHHHTIHDLVWYLAIRWSPGASPGASHRPAYDPRSLVVIANQMVSLHHHMIQDFQWYLMIRFQSSPDAPEAAPFGGARPDRLPEVLAYNCIPNPSHGLDLHFRHSCNPVQRATLNKHTRRQID